MIKISSCIGTTNCFVYFKKLCLEIALSMNYKKKDKTVSSSAKYEVKFCLVNILKLYKVYTEVGMHQNSLKNP